MTLAHIGGVPVEESVQALTPAGAAMAYMAAGLFAWLRRR
jgi:uncharacterized protein (TIGR03382 family)